MKWLSMILAALALSSIAPRALAGQQRQIQHVTIGVVTDGPYHRYTDVLETFRKEIVELLSGEYAAELPTAKLIEAGWSAESIRRAIDTQLADPEVDLVLTLGPIGSHLVAHMGDLPKPAVAPIIIDAELQDLPRSGSGSGVRNLNYVALPKREDILAFQEITTFRRLGILSNAALNAALPEVIQSTVEAGRSLGIEVEVISVDSPVDSALARLQSGFDAVYVLPLLQITEAEFQELVRALIDRRLPSFSWMGQLEVDQGILAGRTPKEFPERLARRTALNIQRILLGEEASTLPVAFPARDRLTINMRTARAIGVYPRWKVLTEALLVDDEERPTKRTLSLRRAVEEAIAANLDLAVQDRAVSAGAQDINLATSNLLPQIDVALDGSLIDEDRAAASFGAQPQRALGGGASLTQVIYAEPLWANRSIQKQVQQARIHDRRAVRLDITLAAGTAYLNILRAKTFERIEKQNLEVTRTNLELAQVRESIGAASPGEVYRWRAQIAANRQNVIDASATRNQVEIELNRLLNRPLEESFATEEASLQDSALIREPQRLFSYIDNPWSFRVFRNFMSAEALVYSPELKAIDALTSAQRRLLRSSNRSFWQPTIALQASIRDIFSKSGAGSSFPDIGIISGTTERDDLAWSVGINISYPLLVGGARIAEKNQAAQDLARFTTERDATAQRVEGRVRAALHGMGASLANIDLSREAAEASRNNFALVSDSYARGAVSIIDLIDAQRAALISEQQAANAIYDFLLDLLRVERAAGRFSFFMKDEDREAFYRRLDEFYEQAGAPPIRR